MGSLARKVKLSEGAKPGIPNLEIYKIDTESAQMTILVSIEELLSWKALKQFALYICRSIRRSYICVLSGLKLSTKKNIWIGIWRITNTSSKVSYWIFPLQDLKDSFFVSKWVLSLRRWDCCISIELVDKCLLHWMYVLILIKSTVVKLESLIWQTFQWIQTSLEYCLPKIGLDIHQVRQ